MNKETLDHLELCIFAERTHDVNFQNIAKELFKEVCFQKEENERLSIELNKNMIERNNYLSRNEKTIEKLKSIRIFGLRSGKTLFSTLINESIDILNGGDDNE